jgi:predicted transcriptional regulator
MTIRVRERDENYWARTRAAVGQAWATGEYQGEELSFATLDQLFSVFTPKRWELIEMLQKTGPVSLRGLSRELHRDVKRVHQDVAVLLEEGVVERTADGKIEVPFALVRFRATIGPSAA